VVYGTNFKGRNSVVLAMSSGTATSILKQSFTTSQITAKKDINGTEVEMPTNAIVKIDVEKRPS
jgi:hypothetical protein